MTLKLWCYVLRQPSRTCENSTENEMHKNILPHYQLFSALLNTDIKHVIYISSGGEIYGAVDQIKPISEETIRNPCTPYGYGKLGIEIALEHIWSGIHRQFTIIRPSNPVGHNQLQTLGTQGLVTTVLYNILHNKPVNILGNGTTIRDYFSVKDLSKLIISIAGHPNSDDIIINASSGYGYSIQEVISICEEITNKRAKVQYYPHSQPKISKNILSNKRAQEHFSWSPNNTLPEIITELKHVMI